MAVRKLKPIEERDPQAALIMDAFYRLEAGLPLASEQNATCAECGLNLNSCECSTESNGCSHCSNTGGEPMDDGCTPCPFCGGQQ